MTHTQLIPANLPVLFQCLRVPAEWRRAPKLINRLAVPPRPPEQEGDLLEASELPDPVTAYDPWEKRTEFFRLQTGDTEGLLTFLGTVGLFGLPTPTDRLVEHSATTVVTQERMAYEALYLPRVSENGIWQLKRMLEADLSAGVYTGRHQDFNTRIVRTKEGPRLILTTTTFMEALLLTLSADQVLNAKVRKCARPDCQVTFTTTSRHERKYCSWYCGHIEAVRRERRNSKRHSKVQRKLKSSGG